MPSEDRQTVSWLVAAAMASALDLALTADAVRAQGGGASDTWVPIGPSGASYIRAIAIDPLTPTTYASTHGDLYTIFKSTDGGSSWTALNQTWQGIVTVLAIDPQTPTTVYAGLVHGFDLHAEVENIEARARSAPREVNRRS